MTKEQIYWDKYDEYTKEDIDELNRRNQSLRKGKPKAESKPKAEKPTKHTKAKVEEPIKRPEGYILSEHRIDFSGLELKLTLPLTMPFSPQEGGYIGDDYQKKYRKQQQQIINNAAHLAEEYKFDVYVLAFLADPLMTSITLVAKEVTAPCDRYYQPGPYRTEGTPRYGGSEDVYGVYGLRERYEGTTKAEVVRDVSANKLTFAIVSFYNRAGNKTPIKK